MGKAKVQHFQHMDILIAQHGECFYCGEHMASTRYPDNKKGFTVDHFVPQYYKLGHFLKFNHVLAHQKCNLKKGHDLPTDEQLIRFRELVGKLLQRNKIITKRGGKAL